MKMKCCILLLLFLQCLGGLGLPLFELNSKVDEALRMSLDEINVRFTRHHLYRVSKATVTKVVPLGSNTYDMMLKLALRETECRKDSGSDPQGCAYRRGFFVVARSEHACPRDSLASSRSNAAKHKVLAPSQVKRFGPDGNMIQTALRVKTLYLRLWRQALMDLHQQSV